MDLSKYCKAYPLDQVRAYPGWAAGAAQLTSGADIVFVHDDYSVTDGPCRDAAVVFSGSSEEWRRFVHTVLDFDPTGAK